MVARADGLEELRTQELPLSFRADFLPATIDEKARTVEVVLSTGAEVERYDWYSGKRYLESLSLDQAAVRLTRLNAGAPLLDSHWGYSVRDQLGVIVPGSARIVETDGKRELRALVKFSEKPSAEEVWRDVKAGIVRNVSIGYRVYRKTLIETAEGKPDRYRCDDWEPFEGSMVTMPADVFAGVRSNSPKPGQPFEPHECVLVRAVQPMITPTATEPKTASTITADEQRALEQAATARESERQTEVRRLCTRHGFDEKFAVELLGRKEAATLDGARTQILAELEKRDAAVDTRGQQGPSGTVGVTDEEKFRDAAVDGLLLRQGRLDTDAPKDSPKRPIDGAREFAGMRLMRLAELCLRRAGVDTTRMSEDQIAQAALSQRSIAPAHGLSDFPKIVANVANKTLRLGYLESPRTFLPFARKVGFNDFKNRSSVTLSTAPDLKRILNNGEVSYATLAENGQVWAILDYAVIFAVTRKTLLNDDADAFEKLPFMFGMSGARLESDIVYALLTTSDGQLLDEDGLAIFHANHLNTGAGVIDDAGIQTGYEKMSVQRAPQGAILNLQPAYLLVPTTRFATAQKWTASITPQQAANVNPFGPQGGMPLTPIAEPRLNADSAAEWYLIARPGQIDTIEIGTLAGQDSVRLDQRIGFERDGLELKASHDFGAAVIDFRGFYRSTGA